MIHLANCSVTINCILKCQEKMALKLFERWACKVGLAHNARPLWCCRRDVSLKEFSALGNVDRSLVKELWVYVVWNFSSDCVRKKFSNVLLEIISIIPLVNCLALTLKKKKWCCVHKSLTTAQNIMNCLSCSIDSCLFE